MSLVTSLSRATSMTTNIHQTPQLVTTTKPENQLITIVGDYGVVTTVDQEKDSTNVDERVFSTTVSVPLNMGLITDLGAMVGGTQPDKVLLLDPGYPIAFTGHQNKIKRLDYSLGWPPLITVFYTQDVQTDWDNRENLTYI